MVRVFNEDMIIAAFCMHSLTTWLFSGALGDLHIQLGRNYKESCNDTDPCNPIQFLECIRGICECHQTEMMYDSTSEACVAKVDFSCLRDIPSKKVNRSSAIINRGENQTDKEVLLGAYQIKCVANARCVYPQDTCQCDFRHYKVPNGTCVHQKAIQQKCTANEQCDEYQFLSCNAGVCACEPGHRYDAQNKKCVIAVGTACKIINYRDINEEHFFQHECPEDSHCQPDHPDANSGVCRCDEGLKVTLDKTCGRNYGEKCSAENKCADVQFICRNGLCQCKYPLHQYYDEETHRCISFSGGPCDIPNSNTTSEDDPVMGCTEHSVCHENTPFNYCRCINGYIETNEGKCIKAFGSKCELDEECDSLPQLACINNVCNCPDKLQTYEEKHRTCVSLAGGRCRKEINGTMPSCTNNAYCVKANGHMEYGRCICARGMYTTVNRVCAKGQ